MCSLFYCPLLLTNTYLHTVYTFKKILSYVVSFWIRGQSSRSSSSCLLYYKFHLIFVIIETNYFYTVYTKRVPNNLFGCVCFRLFLMNLFYHYSIFIVLLNYSICLFRYIKPKIWCSQCFQSPFRSVVLDNEDLHWWCTKFTSNIVVKLLFEMKCM